jgi:tetratricopeptide (TPR) repeat protein
MKKILPAILAATLISQASAETAASKPAQTPAQQAEAFYRQGQAAEKAGDPATARTAYTAALQANPKHANARYSLGELKITSATLAARGREAKFGAVVVPEFKLDGASLQESLDALRIIVEKSSKEQVTPNFVIQDTKSQLAAAKISLNLKAMPAKAVLQYLMDSASAKSRFDEHAIVITAR